MSLSSDDESSGNEYLVSTDKLNLESPFFKASTSQSSQSVVKNENDDTSDSDDEFDCVDDEKLDSAALLAQVMKNLEKANNSVPEQNSRLASPTKGESPEKNSKGESPEKNSKDVLCSEIADLLSQGESGPSAAADDNDDDGAQEIEAEYTIPKEGVDIVLPGSIMNFRRQKKCNSLEEMLRKRMNQRLRSNQVHIHKTGLLCWLAHGFHLNREINDPEVLSTALSLVPPTAYPDGRADLKYLEQFTKWFKNLLKLEFREVKEGVRKETLLARLNERKVHNHRELVLLYIATLRAIGITCRLVISLCPPALKPRSDQLFQNPKSVKKEETDELKRVETAVSKPAKERTKSGKRAGKKETSRRSSLESNSSIVPENSSRIDKNAKEDAKKRAANVLAKFANAPNKKSIKTITESRPRDMEIGRPPGKSHEIEVESPRKKKDETKTPEKKRVESRSSSRPRDDARTPEKIRGANTSPAKKMDKMSPPLARRLRSRLMDRPLKSEALCDKSITSEQKTTKEEEKPAKRTRAATSKIVSTSVQETSKEGKKPVKRTRAVNSKVVSTIVKAESDSDFEDEPPAKKKPSVVSKSVKAETDDDSDEDFVAKPPPRKRRTVSTKKDVKADVSDRDSIDRRVLSSDDETGDVVDAKGAQNIWVEVYVDAEESWISVSVPDDKIHCVAEIYKKAPKPVLYVVAWNSAGKLKDVTRRYCPHWLTVTRKQRVDENWWSETLYPWKEKDTLLSKAEDEMLLQRELEQPLPKTVGECKGHPLYVLTRHLLKFEALYPPECMPLGHLRTGEAIYSRHCVHTLCSRETWVKKARVVKPAQEPYKIVKALPKYDKLSGIKLKDQPLELFGKWQTTQYVPPEAKDGIVPRNEYGNVDLFQQCMLPIGTVHINLPGLNRVARKLNIDCSPAVVGFNFGSRGALPAFEGFVVCEEYEDTLREAWEAEQIEARKRAKEKREKRIYGNWKKLIKGLFIRERLAARYDFKNDEDDDNNDDDGAEDKPSASAKHSKPKTAGARKTKNKQAES